MQVTTHFNTNAIQSTSMCFKGIRTNCESNLRPDKKGIQGIVHPKLKMPSLSTLADGGVQGCAKIFCGAGAQVRLIIYIKKKSSRNMRKFSF